MYTTNDEIAELSRRHLEAVVAIDSQSDERSDTIPSSEGQRRLADWLGDFFRAQGMTVERDDQANVLAALPGRGPGVGRPPLALLCHLDTSRGTAAVPSLRSLPAWDGGRIPYADNQQLCVDIDTYPAAREFLGHTLLFGPGRAPFGLDDKLGLAHMMTLAVLLRADPALPHPPLLLVGRPDEEIGRMAAVEGLADGLARRGVRHGFTIDGVLPFEINVENFYGSQASIVFHDGPLDLPRGPGGADGLVLRVTLGGVNTHGCTAKAEGYRAATRLAAEIVAALRAMGACPRDTVPLSLLSQPERDCDGTLVLYCRSSQGVAQVQAVVEEIVGPHVRKGASFHIAAPEPYGVLIGTRAALDLLTFVADFFASNPGFVLPAEESEARQGYSNPYRAELAGRQGLRLDLRLRDFDRQGLDAREAHVRQLCEARGLEAQVRHQYDNMGPRLQPHAELISWPRQAAATLGITPRLLPIRGGTGVDPFLDRGVVIGNLGTGYFAPESEKEFTSMQMLADHARWLVALVGVIAAG